MLPGNEPSLKGISCLHNRMEVGRRIPALGVTEGRLGVESKVWSLDVPRGMLLVHGCYSPAAVKILVK